MCQTVVANQNLKLTPLINDQALRNHTYQILWNSLGLCKRKNL